MSFKQELGKRILFLDGGMGTLLQEKGLAAGELPETWNISKPEAVREIHRAYLEAGADIILANTFGANGLKFPDRVEALVEAGVKNARLAVAESGKNAYVALDIGPTGKLLKPMGTLDFEEAVALFAQVARAGQAAGAEVIVIETMSDTYELKAAVLGAKEATDLPIIATVIFGENGKMLTGATPEAVVALLEGLKVDVIGMNCGLGPEQMAPYFAQMAACASVPLAISPNAGMPRTENGRTVFDVTPKEFGTLTGSFADRGAWIVGGCCGTTPAHIKALVDNCRDKRIKPLTDKNLTLVSSYSHTVELGKKPVIIGERINPTGKSKFKQALREKNLPYILEEGARQADAGAHILDVNVGLPDISELEMMEQVVYELQSILDTPLQIDTTNIATMEQALRIYNGKAMINSVNGKAEMMEQVFPLVQKYGGVVVALTLDEDGIPETAEGRLAIADRIFAKAAEYGIAAKDIVVDALAMTMSTDDNCAKVTLDTVKALHNMGRKTVLGVSNISFGLPKRELINAAFFTLALESGLSAGIINPNAAAMMDAYNAFFVLRGMDSQCQGYIQKYGVSREEGTSKQSDRTGEKHVLSLEEAVQKGLEQHAAEATGALLKTKEPLQIIQENLVPALDVVGKGFEKGTMFLPQLLKSAEAAKAGFEVLKAHMQKNGLQETKKAVVVLATVEGDIHDIGKNIVKVLLENYAYEVIDLGKDVSPERILEAVVAKKAPLLGLSALMTTTVVSMEKTIRLVREKAPWCKIMVGGAVLTQEYADSIGADFYGKDAMQSVYYAEQQNL